MPPIRVLLVEDHAIVREGTRQMLERDPSIKVVGEAADGLAAVALAAELQPDVVLLDLALPLLNGIEATRQMRAASNPPRVLILSAYDDQDYVRASIDAGANGYIVKMATADDITIAIHAVSRGDMVLHPAVARRFFARSSDVGDRNRLSGREMDILRLAARGVRSSDIATELSVSTRTIEAQFTSIFNKLGVSSRTAAVAQAIERGWLAVRPGPPMA
jgi:DNA-binding NarL/FixJ family response regulator